jgi:hypothetical protein
VITAALVIAPLTLTACGGPEHTARTPDETADHTATGTQVTDSPTSPPTTPSTTAPNPTTGDVPPTGTSTTVAHSWRDDVAALCDRFTEGIDSLPRPDATPRSITGFVDALQDLGDAAPLLAAIDVPADREAELDRIVAFGAAADTSLDAAADALETGHDPAAAMAAVEMSLDHLSRVRTTLTLAGVRCGDADPTRAAAAALNVPLERDAWQVAVGFGSIWVSERLGHRVVRVDPDSGAVVATIDVGAEPFKLQPADGRMWVRTADSYLAVDPHTNRITATLRKADVGADANRSWAVDGALWICDGRRLHRYNPTTVQPVAALDLDVDCGQVHATPSVVVAWSYNEDDGESGTSATAIIDPATNRVLATVDLPVDVGVPVIVDDEVFFPAYGSSRAVVIDVGTWTVTATPDLGRTTAGSLAVTDGRSIYVPTADHRDVLVVDAITHSLTDTIKPLGNNAVAFDHGALWTVGGYDLLQRFSIDESTT